MVEDPATVQVEHEDGNDEDDDESGGEEEYDGKETWLVGGELFQLNVLEVILQAVGKAFRMIVLIAHTSLSDAL